MIFLLQHKYKTGEEASNCEWKVDSVVRLFSYETFKYLRIFCKKAIRKRVGVDY